MDPSNFGSFSSGGNSGGAGVSGAPNCGVAAGTNPNVSNDDPTRTAAEQEYLRRNNGKV